LVCLGRFKEGYTLFGLLGEVQGGLHPLWFAGRFKEGMACPSSAGSKGAPLAHKREFGEPPIDNEVSGGSVSNFL